MKSSDIPSWSQCRIFLILHRQTATILKARIQYWMHASNMKWTNNADQRGKKDLCGVNAASPALSPYIVCCTNHWMQLQVLKANACDFRLDFAAYTRCSKALSIVGKKEVILNLIMAFYHLWTDLVLSTLPAPISHCNPFKRFKKRLPLEALESISFAATPGGLCQLLSNPPTWTWRHKTSRISRT